MTSLFFSYSHADETLRDRLEVHLSMLKRQGVIDVWHDRRIVPGTSFAGSISAELERADLILLLVSADFLASDYCYEIEMKRALERNERGEAHVLPVILKPCDWHSAPFGGLLAVPKDGKPVVKFPSEDEAFLEITLAIRKLLDRREKAPAPAVATRPAAPAKPDVIASSPAPRSGNLRIKREFSDAERDRFLDESFEYIARYFSNSLDELSNRHVDLETTFKRLDARQFTAVIYRGGKLVSRCRVFMGGVTRDGGIAYSNSDHGSFNEQLSVRNDDVSLYLKSLGMSFHRGSADTNLSQEGAAELYWSIFIEPLQR